MSTIEMSLAEREVAVLDSVPKASLIGGEWRTADRATVAVEDPATGAVLAEVPDASVADGLAALEAAATAQADWAATPARQRADLLRRAFEAVIARREEFALLVTLEMGKPLAESRGEVSYGAEYLRWYSEEAVRLGGR
jgi:succinate-semialdehyde dehydrogenase/glutarate-semialdehyde dehydrogenase